MRNPVPKAGSERAGEERRWWEKRSVFHFLKQKNKQEAEAYSS